MLVATSAIWVQVELDAYKLGCAEHEWLPVMMSSVLLRGLLVS